MSSPSGTASSNAGNAPHGTSTSGNDGSTRGHISVRTDKPAVKPHDKPGPVLKPADESNEKPKPAPKPIDKPKDKPTKDTTVAGNGDNDEREDEGENADENLHPQPINGKPGDKSNKKPNKKPDGTSAEDTENDAANEKKPDGKPIDKPDESSTGGAAAVVLSTLLEKKPFVLTVKQWRSISAPDGPTGTGESSANITSMGTIHSRSITADPQTMLLSSVRKIISSMSRWPRVHVFCTASGTSVNDEAMTLADYLDMSGGAVPASKTATPSIEIFFKSAMNLNNPTEAPKMMEGVSAELPDPNKFGEKKALPDMTVKDRKALIDPEKMVTRGSGAAYGASVLDEYQWDTVLSNCGAFYGWVVDYQNHRISRAPRRAFQLRTLPPDQEAIPDATSQVDKKSTAPPSGEGGTKAKDPNKEPKPSEDKNKSSEDKQPTEKESDEKQPHDEINREGGDDDDDKNNTDGEDNDGFDLELFDAATTGSDSPVHVDSGGASAGSSPAKLGVMALDTSSEPAEGDTQTPSDDETAPSRKSRALAPRTKALPTFYVNDNSRIEIIACEHEFEESMAKNSFSGQSTEAAMSGGYAGFAVSVSAGVSTSESKGETHGTNSYSQTLVANYLLPRCDLYLHSNDLEPTPELKELLSVIEKDKNILDLRRLYSEFGRSNVHPIQEYFSDFAGHLFCQRLTIGGRLQTTKISKELGTKDLQSSKEQMRVSVGASVSTPIGVGGSVKHTNDKGESNEHNTSQTDKSETNVFEAVGGDTVLASNPLAWVPTVANYNFWRVISRDGMIVLSDCIAGIKDYEQVQTWFAEAAPAVSEYIQLDRMRQVTCRLKLSTPVNPHNPKLAPGPTNPVHYLGHQTSQSNQQARSITPRLMGILGHDSAEMFWTPNVEAGDALKTLFTPRTYQAPVAMRFSDNMVGGRLLGTDYNGDFADTEWSIVAPQEMALTSGAQVVLMTRPWYDSSKPTQTRELPSHMVVFRNQQGVFLPAMSQNDEVQYFRLWKVEREASGEVHPQEHGEHILEGDEVRLTWSLADQRTGFRDFTEDVFGRRRNQKPHDMEGDTKLYLKMPWPRFESTDRGCHAFVMAPMATGLDVACDMKVLPDAGHYRYVMQDVSFRIDTVANGCFGDAGDYMLRSIAQEGDWRKPPPPPPPFFPQWGGGGSGEQERREAERRWQAEHPILNFFKENCVIM